MTNGTQQNPQGTQQTQQQSQGRASPSPTQKYAYPRPHRTNWRNHHAGADGFFRHATKLGETNVFFIVWWILCIMAFLADLSFQFSNSWTSSFTTYLVIFVVYVVAEYRRLGGGTAVKHGLWRSLFAIGIPLVYLAYPITDGQTFNDLVYTGLRGFGDILAVIGSISIRWAVLCASYLLGWMFFANEQMGRSNHGLLAWIARTMNNIVILVMILGLFLAPLAAASESVRNNPNSVPTLNEIFSASRNTLITAYNTGIKDPIKRLSGQGQNIREQILPTRYTGTIEQQQGSPLGVFLVDMQPIKRSFIFQPSEDGMFIEPVDPEVVFFGTVRARTFADELDIKLSCRYQPPESIRDAVPSQIPTPGSNERVDDQPSTEPVYGKIRPNDKVTVYYTGEFHEDFPYDCSIPMSELGNTLEQTRGLFYVDAEFDFKTWGYVTLGFMERDQITTLKSENIDPAREMGLRRQAQAIYTPGPIELGMESLTLPLGIRYETRDNIDPNEEHFLPSFGITVEDQWRSRGTLGDVNYLIFQVPSPFQLNLRECVGFPAKESNEPVQIEILRGENAPSPTEVSGTGSFSIGDTNFVAAEGQVTEDPNTGVRTYQPVPEDPEYEIPNSYTWYVFRNFDFPPDIFFKTFRCPLHLDGVDAYNGILGPDLSPRTYSFVAMADYNYKVQAPVPVRLSVERFE